MKFAKVTNMQEIKEISKAICRTVKLEPCIEGLFICNHPFTNSLYVLSKDMQLLDLAVAENLPKWYEFIDERIDSWTNINSLLCMIERGWLLSLLCYYLPYLSEEDAATYLKDAWQRNEAPNTFNGLDTIRDLFKCLNKKYLMSDTELATYNALPEKVTLYRGEGSKSGVNGLSWSLNKEQAQWFADRFNAGGIVKEKVVSKKKT